MVKKITFIHSGDIHLGAPICGVGSLTEAWALRMENVIAEAFDRMIRAALNRKVDFVVLAGDIFDTTRTTYRDYLRFFEGIAKLDAAGISTYFVTGNHDPYTYWVKDLGFLPSSAHLLGIDGPTFKLFQRDDQPLCLIGGRSYFSQAWPDNRDIAEGITRVAAEQALLPEFPRVAEAPFSIGIIHTGLDFDKKKAPTNEADLLSRGIDYWACGHLHKRLVRPNDHNPRIVFPGCIQGRTIKETGPHGCYLVELEEGVSPKLEFIPTASVVLEKFKIDTSSCQTLNDLKRHIQAAFFQENGKSHCDEMVAQVTLAGKTNLYEFLSQPEVLERLRKELNDSYPSFYCDALTNRTQPRFERFALDNAGVFTALVQDIANDQRERDEEMINFIQNEFVKRGIPIPLSLTRSIDDFEDAAESLVLQLLEEEQS